MTVAPLPLPDSRRGASPIVLQRRPKKSMTAKKEPILPRVAAGDPAAFQECVDRYKSLIWWLARKWVGADADDAVQEIFLNIWRNAGRYDSSKAAESTYVAMIARRRLIDLTRKRGRRPDHEPIEDQIGIVGQLPESVEAVAEIALAERVIADQLSDNELEVLTLSIHEGMSHSEIASSLNMPLGTVKTHIRRSLAKIRERIAASDAALEEMS